MICPKCHRRMHLVSKLRTRRSQVAVALALVAALLLPGIALAYSYFVDYTITETAGTAYTSLPLSGLSNNTYYATNGYISATGLNTRVFNSDNVALPHMLTEDKTWFVVEQPALNSQIVRYAMGETALTSFDIIPGYDGYITTPDDASLEISGSFDISISGHFLRPSSGNATILYKDGAASLDFTSTGTLTWRALNADNSDNWTLTTAAVANGSHTVRVYSDTDTARLYVDAAEVDNEALSSSGVAITTGAATTSTYNVLNRGVFWTQGLYWIFFRHSNNLAYQTSSDGSSWSGITSITSDNSVTASDKWSSWFVDGGSFYYVLAGVGADVTHFRFRVGDPQSDGSITWKAVEQTVAIGGTLTGGFYFSVSAGIDEKAFVAFRGADGGSNYFYATHNDNTDGTWSTTAGYPTRIIADSAGSNFYTYGIWSDYDSNKAYAIGTSTSWTGTYGYSMCGVAYDGASWSGTVDVWYPNSEGFGIYTQPYGGGAFGSDDSFMFSSVAGGTFYVYATVIDSSGSFSDRLTIREANHTNKNVSVSYNANSDTFYIFYTGADSDFYYRTYSPLGVLSSETLLGATTSTGVVSSTYLFDHHINVGSTTTPSVYHGYIMWPWSWLDNANDWTWMNNNVMSYADNMTISAAGTQVLRYAPDSIISGTTLPDESGNGNDGIFTWGVNPANVEVVPGPFSSGTTPSTPTPGGTPWTLVPPSQTAEPAGLFTEGGECMLGITELANASEATGNPREMFPIMLAFGLALLIGFAVYGATHVAKMGQKGSLLLQSIASLAVLIFFYVGGCGVIPGWVVIPFGIEALFVLVGRNPQHSAT